MNVLLAALLVLAAGALGWWLEHRRGAGLRAEVARLWQRQRRLDDIDDESRRLGERPTATAAERTREMENVLTSALTQLGAARAVIWDVDAAGNRIVPRVAAPGPAGRPVHLAGSPLRWVWEEKLPLRLEAKSGGSGWLSASGGACAVPVEDDAILVFEFEQGWLPNDVTGATDAGRYVAALLGLQNAQAAADVAHARFDQLLVVLEQLTRADAVEAWAAELAESARMLYGGTGAAVASWGSDGGRVLALLGGDGGPDAGLSIEADSELGMAARAGSPIVRPEVSTRMPLAASTERWYARPRSLAVLPLETADGVLGVVAVWNADRIGFDEAGMGALRTLAPYAALQLRQMIAKDTLRERAERDALTGLPNRGAFNERLEDAVKHYRRYHHPLSLILLDVDHFKAVNDTYGHDAGDVVLTQVGHIIATSIRETDFAARLGGEEFAVLLSETDLPQSLETAERIRAAVEDAHIDYDGQAIDVRLSAGVSSCPGVVPDPSGLMTNADAALYASKQGGRNRVTAAGPAMRGS